MFPPPPRVGLAPTPAVGGGEVRRGLRTGEARARVALVLGHCRKDSTEVWLNDGLAGGRDPYFWRAVPWISPAALHQGWPVGLAGLLVGGLAGLLAGEALGYWQARREQARRPRPGVATEARGRDAASTAAVTGPSPSPSPDQEPPPDGSAPPRS